MNGAAGAAPGLADLLGGEPELTPLARGAYHEHHVARVGERRVVLRRCVGSQWGLPPREQLAREHLTLQALAVTGVAPEPVALLHDVLVEELVEGRPFRYPQDLPALAESLRAVHAVPPPEHLPRVDAFAELLADGDAWLARADAEADGAAIALLRAHRERLAPPPAGAPGVLCHTDLNAGNLIVEPSGRCRIVDWEAARVGPRAWDLAHAISPTTTEWDPDAAAVLAPADVAAFLGAQAGATRALLGAVQYRALAWVLGASAQGTADERLRHQLDRFRTAAFVTRVLGSRQP